MTKYYAGFRKKNVPLSADYRPMYKMAIVILILKLVCVASKSSLNKLHFLSWSLKSKKNMETINAVLHGTNEYSVITWGIEPALNRALLIAKYEGLIDFHKEKYILTSKGDEFYKMIIKDSELFAAERNFLKSIGKQLATEQAIEALTQKLLS